jgi:recombination protein RecA
MEEPNNQPDLPQAMPATHGPLSTGSLRLDAALETGGLPRGWIYEIFGGEQSGKTTLCLHLAAAALRQGGMCAWVDADHTLDPAYAIRCGVDPGLFFLTEPQEAEQAIAIIQSLVQSGSLELVVVDSASALVSRAEMQMPLGTQGNSGIETTLSRYLPLLSQAAQRYDVAVIFTNRSWPGAKPVYHELQQHPEKLALKLQAAIRLQIEGCRVSARAGAGYQAAFQAHIVKNRFSRNNRAIRLDFVYNEVNHETGDIFDLSSAYSLIRQQDSRYYYHETLLGGTRDEAMKILLKDRRLAEKLEADIRRHLMNFE